MVGRYGSRIEKKNRTWGSITYHHTVHGTADYSTAQHSTAQHSREQQQREREGEGEGGREVDVALAVAARINVLVIGTVVVLMYSKWTLRGPWRRSIGGACSAAVEPPAPAPCPCWPKTTPQTSRARTGGDGIGTVHGMHRNSMYIVCMYIETTCAEEQEERKKRGKRKKRWGRGQ